MLVRTDHSASWGTEAYAAGPSPPVGRNRRAAGGGGRGLRGIDSLNIDGTGERGRPVHTTLLAAEIPIIEHLTGLDALPADGFTFTAVPPKIEGAGTFTVRAFATLP